MKPIIVVHHHEITLKGNNRHFFEGHLRKNVRTVLSGIAGEKSVTGGYGRFFISLDSESDFPSAIDRLRYVFGLANICAGFSVPQDVDVFSATAVQLLRNETFSSLRVVARRPDKRFSTPSMEVNRVVGGVLCETFGVRADMSNPDVTVYIEIIDGGAIVYTSKTPGAGGLPVGVSGSVVGLLSAGFDSPVACWQLIRRGARVLFVHFHSMPYTGRESLAQVRQLTEILTRYQFRSKLHLVPFAELQQEIVLHCPQPLRVVLYRRMMIRIAEEIAGREGAEALVTGEAVGQVASQTLRNIRVINDAARLPILRPLSGADKEDTMEMARRIGTYEISKEPFDDCCSFLAPRRPETWASPSAVADAEAALNIPGLVRDALARTEVESFAFPRTAVTTTAGT